MALSEYERKMLEELEAQLSDEDPGFADTLKPKSSPKAAARQVSIRHLVLGLLVVFAGIAILTFGVSAEIEIIGLLGIVVMFLGTWYMTTGITSFPNENAENEDPKPKQPKTPRSNKFQDFMARQAEEWEKRRRR
jgi:Protein of unknown function (DUF3040).